MGATSNKDIFIYISTARPIFYSGEDVEGCVYIRTKKATKFTSLYLRF
jgi:hypothetical protein